MVGITYPSTRNKDLVTKLNTYCLSGVKEYWVVAESQEKIIVYSFQNRQVEEFGTFSRGEVIHSYVFVGLTMDTEALFAGLL